MKIQKIFGEGRDFAMKQKLKSLIAAAIAACSIATVTPVSSVMTAAATSTVQSESKTTTMYVTKTAYSYVKKDGKLVKSAKLNKGDAIEVKTIGSKYYILTDGKYVLKANVGSKQINWTETKLSKAVTKYVQSSAKVLDKALSSGKKLKTLSSGTKITVVAKTNSGYFKLKDGGYIKQSLVGNSKPGASKVSAPSAAAKKAGSGITLSKSEGKTFVIYCWNEEFKDYFERYYTVPKGVKVEWVIYPTYDGEYQERLDMALMNNSSAKSDEKVDLFLAEPDYIRKYVDSKYTMDVSKIGVKPYSTEYEYTYTAATDKNGKLKGVSFQLCPSALIYRRSIAEEVLGTSDPDEVQSALSTWDKFNEVARKAGDKGYYMTPSYAETFRVFSQNKSSAWVDSKNRLQIDPAMEAWFAQTKEFVDSRYTLPVSLWSEEKSLQMASNGKTMCLFGPSWYYNYCMWYAYDEEYNSAGDWAICQGPQASYWGGTWLLAASGSDNPEMIADVMNAFTANESICTKLVENEGLFVNNTKVMKKFADSSKTKSEFLGGQNDIKVLDSIAKNIKYKNATVYDYYFDDCFISVMTDYLNGYYDLETAMHYFYCVVNEIAPSVITAE